MFLVLIVTIIKSGVDAALRLWTGLGALTGVALGSIITFYFRLPLCPRIWSLTKLHSTFCLPTLRRIHRPCPANSFNTLAIEAMVPLDLFSQLRIHPSHKRED